MATTALPASRHQHGHGGGVRSAPALAFRNLWRNPRRSWLTAGGIALAVWLLVFSLSSQDGSFEIMIDNSARLLLGHVQLQHPDYRDNPRLEHLVENAGSARAMLEAQPEVALVAPRLQAFALLSSGERSFGAQVLGVDPVLEADWSTLPTMLDAGRYLAGSGEAFLGATLARNIGVGVGDEIVLLGTSRERGVAAAVAEVVGTFDTGQPALDRALLQIPIDDFRAAWELGADDVHVLVVTATTAAESERLAARLDGGDAWQALDWRGLMPEAEQTVELKAIGAYFFFALVALIVTFSVVNTFLMTLFERTPEFGMLLAVGMKPRAIQLQLQLEALWMAGLGVLLGWLASAALIVPLSQVGMPLPADASEVLARYNMPDRMYPTFSFTAAWVAGVIMILSTQIAALVPGLKLRKLKPVDALRGSR